MCRTRAINSIGTGRYVLAKKLREHSKRSRSMIRTRHFTLSSVVLGCLRRRKACPSTRHVLGSCFAMNLDLAWAPCRNVEPNCTSLHGCETVNDCTLHVSIISNIFFEAGHPHPTQGYLVRAVVAVQYRSHATTAVLASGGRGVLLHWSGDLPLRGWHRCPACACASVIGGSASLAPCAIGVLHEGSSQRVATSQKESPPLRPKVGRKCSRLAPKSVKGCRKCDTLSKKSAEKACLSAENCKTASARQPDPSVLVIATAYRNTKRTAGASLYRE